MEKEITSAGARRKGSMIIVLAAVLWGTLPLSTRHISAFGVEGIQIAAMRCYLTALLCLAVSLMQGRLQKPKLRHMPFYFFYGLFAIVGTFTFYVLAIERLSIAMASILLYTAPAFVTIFSRIFYKEPITRRRLLALFTTFLGSFLVVRAYDFSSLTINAAGIIFGLLSGISYCMLTIFGRKGLSLYNAQTNCTLQMLFGSLCFLFICPPWKIPVRPLELSIGFVTLSLFSSFLPQTLYMRGLEMGVEGGNASVMATIEPLVATILGVIVYRDTLTGLQVLGMALTLAGAALPGLSRQKT